MNDSKRVTVITLLIILLMACSEVPFDRTVKDLIKNHYEQTSVKTNEITALDHNDESDKAFNELIQSAMPTLDKVDNVNCETTQSADNFLCSADITQTMNGHTSTNQASFRIKRVNNRWTLAL